MQSESASPGPRANAANPSGSAERQLGTALMPFFAQIVADHSVVLGGAGSAWSCTNNPSAVLCNLLKGDNLMSTLDDTVTRTIENLKRGRYSTEAAVSQGILLPLLNSLGWPVFDTSVVIPEYALEGRRVDFALCHPAGRPAIFIEVKAVGSADGGDRQLFEYAFHRGVPFAVLTDGQEWSFYLPGEQGKYDERRVYKLDLLERSVQETCQRLSRYLRHDAVCSGNALKWAREDYKNVARVREIKDTLPRAWETLLREQDSLLLELLAEKVESLCGYKPELDDCAQFLRSHLFSGGSVRGGDEPDPTTLGPHLPKPPAGPHGPFEWHFRKEKHDARSARDLMAQVFQRLHQEDRQFLERFAARKHARKRRYLSKNKYDLYPGRPDLVDKYSEEIVPGWWLGTNYSRRDIQKIIDLAREVAGPRLGAAVSANVDA